MVATSSVPAVTATPSTTSPDSATTVCQCSGVGEARGHHPAPRGVEGGGAHEASPTTVNDDTASVPSMTIVRSPVVRSMTWTSTRVQPSDTSITNQRPSRDSSTDGHAVLSGRSANTTSSWPGSSPRMCHRIVRL